MSLTPEQWRTLAGERVFFGHQSVGANLIAGVSDILAENPFAGLRVVETSGAARFSEPGLYHGAIGSNGEPESKIADFVDRIGEAAEAGPVIGLMKFCYVDVDAETDTAALFASYRAAVERLQRDQNGVTLVHVTMPLTADRGDWFHLKTVLRGKGRRSDRRLNLARHRYNQALRATYGGREPLFDLARIEATGRDDRPSAVRHDGVDVPVLAREWTYDGGHLNPAGRKRAASALLEMLAALAASGRRT